MSEFFLGADIATGRAIKFNSGLAQPSWDLALNEICVPSIAEGKEVIVTRSPLVNSNGVIVLTNKHLPEAKSQQGTIHIHPETAAEHLQADFDGDRLAFEVATKYPTLAAEIKEYNLEANRYPDVVKAKKVAYTGSFEEIALSARENKIGLIANQIQKAVALQWETQLIPAEKKPEYFNQIINYYKRLLKDDSNPSRNIQLDSQFRVRIEKLANLPHQLTPQQIEQSLGEVKKILFDVVSELSNELQVAVDGPKSAARPNEPILSYCKAISEYTPLGWLADKKNPEAFQNRSMNSTNYSPIDLMVQQANQLFKESHLSARPVVEFNPIFQGVRFTEKHSAYAREISSTYNRLIKQALVLSERAKKESGPSLIATSAESGKQIEITNLLKFDEPSSPVWTQSHLDIKLYPNTNKSLKNTLMAVVMTDSENKPIYQPIGTVSEESVKEHNLRTGIRLSQASISLTPGATANQVKAKFQEAAQYLDDVRQNTPENEQLPLAAAIWHVNHGRSEDSNNLKKASVAFNAFPDLVVNQLSKLQFTNLTVVGVHQPTNELLGKRWNGEKVQGAIALDADSNSFNHGKKIVVVDGKKFAPLSSESPSLPIGTKFEATIFAPPGAAVIATTPKGNSLKVTQINKHAFSNREWNGELTQIQVGFFSNSNPDKPSTPVALVDNKVLGVLDKESVEKLKSANLLLPGATFSVSLETTPGTTAYVTVDPQSVVYPHQQQLESTKEKQDSPPPTLPDKSPQPDDWVRVARALGKSPKYVERVKEVTTAHRAGLPLSEQALKVMQQDFDAYKQISSDQRQWKGVALALGKSVAYQKRITEVAIAFHHPKQPAPLSEKAIASMQQDLHNYRQQNTTEQLIWQQEALLTAQAVRLLFNQLLIDVRIRQPDGSSMFEATNWRFAQQGEQVTITTRQDNREILRIEGNRLITFAPTPVERAKLEEFRQDIAHAMEEKQQQNFQQYQQQRQRGARI